MTGLGIMERFGFARPTMFALPGAPAGTPDVTIGGLELEISNLEFEVQTCGNKLESAEAENEQLRTENQALAEENATLRADSYFTNYQIYQSSTYYALKAFEQADGILMAHSWTNQENAFYQEYKKLSNLIRSWQTQIV